MLLDGSSKVYIVMECIGGGELFTHLRRARKFSDEQSKFYAAQARVHINLSRKPINLRVSLCFQAKSFHSESGKTSFDVIRIIAFYVYDTIRYELHRISSVRYEIYCVIHIQYMLNRIISIVYKPNRIISIWTKLRVGILLESGKVGAACRLPAPSCTSGSHRYRISVFGHR